MTDNLVDLTLVWDSATDEVSETLISPQQRAYLRLTRLRALVEDTALISVPDTFTRDVIETKLRPAITEALSRRLGRAIQVAVTVRPPDNNPSAPLAEQAEPDPEPPVSVPGALPFEDFKKVIDQELAAAGASASK